MGVQGLLDYISRNPTTRERVKLGELAQKLHEQTGKDAQLVCDYFSVIQWLLSSFDHSQIQRGKLSPYSIMYGGDLNHYSSAILSFVRAIRSLNIEPVFFVDGTPGSNKEEFPVKLEEWKRRYLQKLERCTDIQQVCDGNQDLLKIQWKLTEGISMQVLFALKSAAVQVIYCSGEADPCIVDYLRSHKEACGVLSTDTDFAIASGSRLFHVAFFDIEKDPSGFVCENPSDISCDLVTPDGLARALWIRTAQLVDLSILCGNDYTKESNIHVSPQNTLNLNDTKVGTVAEWLQSQTTPLLEISAMSAFCEQHPNYRAVVEHSYAVYSTPTGNQPETEDTDPFHVFLHDQVQKGLMAPCFCSVTNGIYWRSVVTEPVALGKPCFNDLTLSLRKSLYAMMGMKEVREYGRTSGKTFTEVTVNVPFQFSTADSLELLKSVGKFSKREKLAALFLLMVDTIEFQSQSDITSLFSRGSHMKLEDDISPEATMVCASLLLIQYTSTRLKPSPRIKACEVEALLVASLLCITETPLCHSPDLPPTRAVTIAMWFTHILEQVCIAASFFSLSECLPPPGRIFYPLAYVPLHTVAFINEDSDSSLASPSIAEAFRIFSKVLSFPAVLALRATILKTSRRPNLPKLLCLFHSSLEAVAAHRDTLTPRVSLSLCLPPEIVLSFGTTREKEDDEESTPSENLIEPTLDFDISECLVIDSKDAESKHLSYTSESSSEGVVECEELPSSQEYILSEEYLYISKLSQQELKLEGEEDDIQPPTLSTASNTPEPTIPVEIQGLANASEDLEPRPRFCSKKKAPHSLPVLEHRVKILDLVNRHRVVCIEGETGCGKSTKIPQFILDQALSSDPPSDCKILVTQPRRVAAIKLAERVAVERRERVGKTVGYCIGGVRHRSTETALTYCTTGYLLQVLIHHPDTITNYTHIILDEIHERSTDADFAMLVVRKLAAQALDIKIIVMSATMQGELLVRYFEEVFNFTEIASPYFVGAKRYPVKWFFIDQLHLLATKERVYWHKAQVSAAIALKHLVETKPDEKLKDAITAKPLVTRYAQDVCTEVIISQANLGESVLVFLPGIAEIAAYYEHLIEELQGRDLAPYFAVFIMHSQVPLDDQKLAFEPPSDNKVHVILATNIAESSITLPMLRIVINFGIYRQLEYNSRRHISCLVKKWCSHASCAQRSGRAGRVFEGIVVHLFTEQFYKVILSEYDPPEILTAPLSKLVLQSKQIGAKLGIPSPSQFLSLAIEPPSLQQMEAALQDLADMGAIVSQPGEEVSEEAEITLLGHFSLSLPVDLVLSRLILYGICFGCGVDAIVMAASMSLTQDVFTLPSRVVIKGDEQFGRLLRKSMDSRYKLDHGVYSDAITMCSLFREWITWRNYKLMEGRKNKDGKRSRFQMARTFGSKYAVRWERLLHFESSISELASRVLVHIPECMSVHGEMKKLAALAKHQRIYSWNSGLELKRNSSGMLDVTMSDFTFSDDPDVLKTLLAAAFPHQIIVGAPESESLNPKERIRAQKTLQLIRNSGFDFSRTLIMKGLKKSSTSSLQNLVAHILPSFFCQARVVDECGLIEFQHTFYSNPKTAILRAQEESTNEAASDSPYTYTNNQTVVMSTLPDEAYYFWQFGERRPVWRAEGISDEFTKPRHPCALTWNCVSPVREIVNVISWRNLPGLVCDHTGEPSVYLATASSIQGCENHHVVTAKGITVLPNFRSGPTAILMALAFQPLNADLKLKVDTANKEIVSLQLNSQEIPFTGMRDCPTGDDIVRINALRRALSKVLSSPFEEGLVSEDMYPIPHLVEGMLKRRSLVRTEPAIEEETGQENCAAAGTSNTSSLQAECLVSSAPNYIWETAIGRKHKDIDHYNDDFGMLTDAGYSDRPDPTLYCFRYYPPLKCSLVDTSSGEVQMEGLPIPYSFQSTDALMESSRLQEEVTEAHAEGEDSFKLSPFAKPFVPLSNDAPQEPTLEPTANDQPPSRANSTWSLASLSRSLHGNSIESDEKDTECTAIQKHSFVESEHSRSVSDSLFPPALFGFGMPSSPAHDYFSPEGNRSCSGCYNLTPHLLENLPGPYNMTKQQLSNAFTNFAKYYLLARMASAVQPPKPLRQAQPNSREREESGVQSLNPQQKPFLLPPPPSLPQINLPQNPPSSRIHKARHIPSNLVHPRSSPTHVGLPTADITKPLPFVIPTSPPPPRSMPISNTMSPTGGRISNEGNLSLVGVQPLPFVTPISPPPPRSMPVSTATSPTGGTESRISSETLSGLIGARPTKNIPPPAPILTLTDMIIGTSGKGPPTVSSYPNTAHQQPQHSFLHPTIPPGYAPSGPFAPHPGPFAPLPKPYPLEQPARYMGPEWVQRVYAMHPHLPYPPKYDSHRFPYLSQQQSHNRYPAPPPLLPQGLGPSPFHPPYTHRPPPHGENLSTFNGSYAHKKVSLPPGFVQPRRHPAPPPLLPQGLGPSPFHPPYTHHPPPHGENLSTFNGSYSHKKVSLPPGFVQPRRPHGFPTEIHTVKYFEDFLKFFGGKASLEYLCGPIYCKYKEKHNSRSWPTMNWQFFAKYSDKFALLRERDVIVVQLLRSNKSNTNMTSTEYHSMTERENIPKHLRHTNVPTCWNQGSQFTRRFEQVELQYLSQEVKAPTANIARTQSLRDITTSPEDVGTSGHQAGGEDSSWEALELQPPWISEGGGLEYQLKAQPPQAEDERMQSGGLKDQLEARPLQAQDERMQSGGLEDQLEARPPQAQDEGMQTGGLEDLLMARPLQVEDERMQSGGLEDQLMARPLQAEDERMQSGGLKDLLMARPLQVEDERVQSGGLEDQRLEAESGSLLSEDLGEQSEVCPLQGGGLSQQEPHLAGGESSWEDQLMCLGPKRDISTTHKADDETTHNVSLEDQHPIPERDKDHVPAHPQVMVCGPEEDTGWLEGCPPVFLHPAEENLFVEGREESRSFPPLSEEDNSEWVESGESPISQRESFETAASSFDGGWKETSPSPVTSSCGSTHSSPKVGTPEHMENFFCEHLMRYGGQMQVERLWQHYRNAFQLPAQPTASREFFEQRPHLFAISERSNLCFIQLMKTNSPMGAQPLSSVGSEKMVQFFCDYLKRSGNYSSFCHLCTVYRATHCLTGMQCWLDKNFFLLRPNIFHVLEKEGSCQIKLKDPGKISPTKVRSEEETEMVRFFRNYLGGLGHEAGFVRLCKAYRSTYRIPLSMLRLDKKFFMDRPHLFVVRESQGSCLIKLNLELDNKQVEKAVISYLSENNMMAFLSDLKNNEKLKKVCQDCYIQLTRSFFLSRSQLFEVVQRAFDASENDCFVILKSRAVLKEYASSSSGDSSPVKKSTKRQPRSAPSSGRRRQQHGSSQRPRSSEVGGFQTRNSIAKQQ